MSFKYLEEVQCTWCIRQSDSIGAKVSVTDVEGGHQASDVVWIGNSHSLSHIHSVLDSNAHRVLEQTVLNLVWIDNSHSVSH